MDEILVAVITAGLSLIGTVITVLAANRQTLAKLQRESELSDQKIHGEIAVIKTEIKTLSERVEAHNKIVERTYYLEGAVSELQHNVRDLKGA